MSDIPRSWLMPGDACFWVAEEAETGAVLGTVAARRGGPLDQHTPVAELQACDTFSVFKLSTAREARGRGVARQLMQAVEEFAAASGGSRVTLVTGSFGAKLFYARCGYTLTAGGARGTSISEWTKELSKE